MRSCTLRWYRRLFVSGAVHGTVSSENKDTNANEQVDSRKKCFSASNKMTEIDVTDKVDNSPSVNIQNTIHPTASLHSFTQQDKQRVYI
ncbi:hypothetical protein BDB00DRAFT_827896, partial [Zychaea mexicana]|uniref:uncharacterized protein n=1 Tax=Zychaea mexicana TaxID=64656 RepID=UPI0022FF1F4A